MKKVFTLKNVIKITSRFFTFFIFVAFAVSCCVSLFVSFYSKELGIVPSNENLQMAAKFTFANSLLVSFIFTVVDSVRRKLTIDRCVKKYPKRPKK